MSVSLIYECQTFHQRRWSPKKWKLLVRFHANSASSVSSDEEQTGISCSWHCSIKQASAMMMKKERCWLKRKAKGERKAGEWERGVGISCFLAGCCRGASSLNRPSNWKRVSWLPTRSTQSAAEACRSSSDDQIYWGPELSIKDIMLNNTKVFQFKHKEQK